MKTKLEIESSEIVARNRQRNPRLDLSVGPDGVKLEEFALAVVTQFLFRNGMSGSKFYEMAEKLCSPNTSVSGPCPLPQDNQKHNPRASG